MEKEELKKRVADFRATLAEMNAKYSEWYRHIITIATGLLSILVALKSTKSHTHIQHLSYAATLISLILGILSSLIASYGEMHALKKALHHKGESILQRLSGETPSSKFLSPGKFYALMRYFSYLFYVLALISIIIYGISSDL